MSHRSSWFPSSWAPAALFWRRSGQVPDRLTRTPARSASFSSGVRVAVTGVAVPEVVNRDDDGATEVCEKLRFSETNEAAERSDSASDMSPYDRCLDIAKSHFSRPPDPSASSPEQWAGACRVNRGARRCGCSRRCSLHGCAHGVHFRIKN
eukprot:scaffold8154_cov112-Isochrysis_galbana.AAC.3